MTGVGEKSIAAVYRFGNYFNLGCWKDKPDKWRTMSFVKTFRGLGFLDWNDMSKMGLYLNDGNTVNKHFYFSTLTGDFLLQ